jgi:hypothetical protein
MVQVRVFQVKAVSFHITKHFFNPHAATIQVECGLREEKISRQQPRPFFACGMASNDVSRVGTGSGQDNIALPNPIIAGAENGAIAFIEMETQLSISGILAAHTGLMGNVSKLL